MANLVLYRKYRPKTFAEVVGQTHVVTTLKNALALGICSHAYLFAGPRGSGKTTIARILAKAINCSDQKEGEPCNRCASCEEINSGRAIDLIEIDAASNRGIDEVRDLKEGIRFAPTMLKYKVYIVDEAHQLTKEAANALLKTLEEPPAHAIFILATTEAHKMIPTILSRCQKFDFRKLKLAEIVRETELIAEKEDVPIEKSALELIAANAQGSLRDALTLLDKVLTFHLSFGKKEGVTADLVKELLGVVDASIVSEFVDLLVKKDAAKAIEFLNENLEKGMDPLEFAKNAVRYLRNVLVVQVNPTLQNMLDDFTEEQKQKIAEQAKGFDATMLPKVLFSFMEAENKMKYSSIVQLPLELAIIESCGLR